MLDLQRQDDTTVPLWEWYFKVRVPTLQNRSIAEMKLFGTHVSGVKEMDNDLQNQWTTTMATVAQMVELYQRGIAVKVILEKDTKQIYEFISDHINAWRQQLERGINIGNAPIDDLIAMDEFANLVYENAKYQFTRETADSFISRHLTSIHRFNGNNFLNPSALANLNSPPGGFPGVTHINQDPEDEIPDRESLGDFFKDRIITFRGGKRW